jgi:hypothetical protein
MVINIAGISCKPEVEVTVEKTKKLASGPQTEQVNKNEYSKIYYVADDLGSDETGEGSMEKPWSSINHALSQISDASTDERIAILISGGDYSKSTIEMKEYVDLYGGFSDKDWQRDIAKNVTVLSGDGIVRGKGAAIYADAVSPQITNNIFYRNKTLKPVPWNPKFIHETAHDGGAIYCRNSASPLIKNNVFIHNKTENGRGAAIAFDNKCRGKIIDNVFIENVAGTDDPMRSSDGGAISIFDWCNTNIVGNVILSNRADSKNDGGGIFIALWSSANVVKNVFVDNFSGDDAGALFVGGQEHRYDSPLDPLPPKEDFFVSIKENTFLGNKHGGNNSGAMRFTMESRGEFINNTVAISNGIYFQRSEIAILNNTIMENFLFVETKEGLQKGTISGNTIWGNFSIMTDVTVENNNIRDGYKGEGNYSREPVFKNDGFDLITEALSYQTLKFYTEAYDSRLNLSPGSLVGRVVHAGGKWGVVRSNERHSVTVWGDLQGELNWIVLPTYSLMQK